VKTWTHLPEKPLSKNKGTRSARDVPIRCSTMIISVWWLRTSSRLSSKKSKKQPENFGNGQLLSGCRFVQNIAPPSLSLDRRIKMEQTNKH